MKPARRPTLLPLTATELAQLDHLVRRAADRLGPDEAGILLRLWEHDRTDRAQEQRSAGGTRAAARRSAEQLRTAEHRLTVYRVVFADAGPDALDRLSAALADAGLDLAAELDRIADDYPAQEA
ncbi:hypothetical protein ACIQOW_08505 [Kitasatospora sp. NPDC091335]|uniref:hypothetical protein n=1 Tax=Kitasatospora sp. NPDC091335 TaxID=3364085 RepID=UPI00382E9D9B